MDRLCEEPRSEAIHIVAAAIASGLLRRTRHWAGLRLDRSARNDGSSSHAMIGAWP